MAIANGRDAFSVGRDCQIVIVHPLAPSGRIDLPNLTMFTCKQETVGIKVDRLDGVQLNAELPKGWSISIENERHGPGLDDLSSLIEAAWYNSGTYSTATIYQYITEPNGSVSTYQFDSVALKFSDPGDWKGDSSVKQSISGMCNRRRKL